MLVQAAATAKAGRAGGSRHNGRRGSSRARGGGVIVGILRIGRFYLLKYAIRFLA